MPSKFFKYINTPEYEKLKYIEKKQKNKHLHTIFKFADVIDVSNIILCMQK